MKIANAYHSAKAYLSAYVEGRADMAFIDGIQAGEKIEDLSSKYEETLHSHDWTVLLVLPDVATVDVNQTAAALETRVSVYLVENTIRTRKAGSSDAVLDECDNLANKLVGKPLIGALKQRNSFRPPTDFFKLEGATQGRLFHRMNFTARAQVGVI